jgi:pyridoxine 5-phosphate synthase
MTKLSVNINKIATLRNARGGNVPDLLKATDIQKFGGQGILYILVLMSAIRYQDARDLKAVVYTEFNIEGNPHNFIDLVLVQT